MVGSALAKCFGNPEERWVVAYWDGAHFALPPFTADSAPMGEMAKVEISGACGGDLLGIDVHMHTAEKLIRFHAWTAGNTAPSRFTVADNCGELVFEIIRGAGAQSAALPVSKEGKYVIAPKVSDLRRVAANRGWIPGVAPEPGLNGPGATAGPAHVVVEISSP
jgi:hypothetical protein